MKRLTTETARDCALALINGTKFGEWTEQGLNLTEAASRAFREVGLSQLVDIHPESRKSPSGNDFDLYAESVWHALCALLYQELFSRLHRGTYHGSMDNINKVFGGRPFYRGQARPWDIIPNAWRSKEYAELSKRAVPIFEMAIREHIEANPDPIAVHVGRPDFGHTLVGLAQHYGLPTNLVDFTFNPLVAVCFACANTEAPEVSPRDLSDNQLRSCAVIYCINAHVLSTAANIKFEFPPSFSRRLYQQKGLFADFGSFPGQEAIAALNNYSEQWCWLQQNCQRIFFPRSYPVINGADELRDNHLMEGDDFFTEVAKKVIAGKRAGPGYVKEPTPWAFDKKDIAESGKRAADSLFRIDAYLRRACLTRFEDRDAFDPLLVALLRKDVAPELQAIQAMAEYVQYPGLSWTAGQLAEAFSVLDNLKI